VRAWPDGQLGLLWENNGAAFGKGLIGGGGGHSEASIKEVTIPVAYTEGKEF
jgi:hypothetical protein